MTLQDEKVLEIEPLVIESGGALLMAPVGGKLHDLPSRHKNKLFRLTVFATILLAAFLTRNAINDHNDRHESRRQQDADSSKIIQAELVNQALQEDVHEQASTDAETEKLYNELAQKTPLPLPLQPPYRIVQVGNRRTGTTWQFQLLDAIAQVKSIGEQHHYKVEFMGYVTRSTDISKAQEDYPASFVAKSHNLNDKGLAQAQREGKLVVFTAGLNPEDRLYNVGLYHQQRVDLEACSMCEIDKYQPIFGLTDQELELIKEYMSAYEKIRQCCGFQMSHAERLRLKGCPERSVNKLPNPHCELIDKHQAEQDVVSFSHIIEHRASTPDDNWQQPGDCDRFDRMIAIGYTRKGYEYFDSATMCP